MSKNRGRSNNSGPPRYDHPHYGEPQKAPYLGTLHLPDAIQQVQDRATQFETPSGQSVELTRFCHAAAGSLKPLPGRCHLGYNGGKLCMVPSSMFWI